MPFTTTTKWALRRLTGASVGSDIDAGFEAVTDDVEPLLTPWDQGLLAARPVSTPAQPSGKAGRVYYATDFGLSFRDTGIGWAPEGVAFGVPMFWPGTGDLSYELLRADGRTIEASTAPAFFAAFGHLFNAGASPGTGLVRIPNLIGRGVVGADPSGAVIPNSPRAVGQTGGEERHTQTEAELAPHDHPFTLPQAGQFGATGGDQFVEIAGSRPTETGPAGGGQAFNVMQPYLALTPIVRVR